MFSKEMMTTKQMLQAILVGVGVGLVGVGCFVLLLMMANDSAKAPSEPEEGELVEVATGPPQQSAYFYAVQHGAFSTKESATAFMTGYPTLNKALVVEVDKQFYVWSALANEKKEVVIEPSAFMKKVEMQSVGCEQEAVARIPLLLQDEKALKLNFEASGDDNVPKEWTSFMQGLTTLSSDLDVLRLHGFAHFFAQQSCLQVKFDL